MAGPADSATADVALLSRVAARDQDALATLYDRHHRLLFSVILRILRDRGESEDVLQEVFVRIWDRADTYSPVLGSPSSWLVRVARNRSIDRLRARQVRSGIADPIENAPAAVDETPAGNPEILTAQSELGRTVRSVMAELPPEQRVLLEAAYFDGYTQSELSERFQMPLGTVKTRIRSAMQTLRERLVR